MGSRRSSETCFTTSDPEPPDLEQGIQREKSRPVEIPWDKDPANAMNWSKANRIYHTLIPAGCAFICTLASSIYTPGIPEVSETFNVSEEVALIPYSIYVIGLAFGPTVSAPLSETFGRRIVYQTCVPVFALFILGSGFAQNIETLIILRFFAGFFGSPSLSIGSATISDIWAQQDRAIPMSSYVATPFLAPALGPLLGGYSTMGANWRWNAWITLFFSIICLAPVYLGMRETYKKIILEKRAKRERKSRGESEPSRPPMGPTLHRFFRQTLSRPLYMLFTEPIPGLFALYVAFNFAVQYTFYAAFPLVFESAYGFSLGQVGLTFLGLGVGVFFGFLALIYFNLKPYKRWVIELKTAQAKETRKAQEEGRDVPSHAKTPPPAEWRLILAFPASILMPISLFLFAWTVGRTHWIVPVIAEALFGMAQLQIFMAATMYVMDCYGPLFGASAMAANTLLRYILSAAFPLFALQMYRGLGPDWATSLLAFVSCVLAVIPWCFWRWGPALRRRSGFKTEQ
ncbi:MFS general substrate transporter [Aulographum hederae CBS 113979]|uniref:MFS general substrate transporter n=1 Tax=Aulographum hederae CBS 113979 TaxID=1176131 RepID=A0A6G1HHC6_9PEZI|nr:MFS general substrate transporter [Aulographum hederae CBS 113979]